MDKLCSELRGQAHTLTHRQFIQLFNNLIEEYRRKNDTAPREEVRQNQGAIKVLKNLIKATGTRG